MSVIHLEDNCGRIRCLNCFKMNTSNLTDLNTYAIMTGKQVYKYHHDFGNYIEEESQNLPTCSKHEGDSNTYSHGNSSWSTQDL